MFAWWQETARANRAEIREVADLYFARFEARLEKGLAEVRADMATRGADLCSGMAAHRADAFARIPVLSRYPIHPAAADYPGLDGFLREASPYSANISRKVASEAASASGESFPSRRTSRPRSTVRS